MLLIPSYIKFFIWAVFCLSGITLLLIYVLPAGIAANTGPKDIPTLPGETIQLTGVVKDFSSNRNGDIDQFILVNADSENRIYFPPHTARQVMQLARKGTIVLVIVRNGPPPPPHPAGEAPGYQLEQLQVGDAVLPLADIPPPPPAAGKPVELNGTVDSLITGRRGEIVGFIVNGCRITLPPHLARSIAPLLQQGKPISINGYERISNNGYVNTDQRTLIKPYRMTIDSTDYLL